MAHSDAERESEPILLEFCTTDGAKKRIKYLSEYAGLLLNFMQNPPDSEWTRLNATSLQLWNYLWRSSGQDEDVEAEQPAATVTTLRQFFDQYVALNANANQRTNAVSFNDTGDLQNFAPFLSTVGASAGGVTDLKRFIWTTQQFITFLSIVIKNPRYINSDVDVPEFGETPMKNALLRSLGLQVDLGTKRQQQARYRILRWAFYKVQSARRLGIRNAFFLGSSFYVYNRDRIMTLNPPTQMFALLERLLMNFRRSPIYLDAQTHRICNVLQNERVHIGAAQHSEQRDDALMHQGDDSELALHGIGRTTFDAVVMGVQRYFEQQDEIHQNDQMRRVESCTPDDILELLNDSEDDTALRIFYGDVVHAVSVCDDFEWNDQSFLIEREHVSENDGDEENGSEQGNEDQNH